MKLVVVVLLLYIFCKIIGMAVFALFPNILKKIKYRFPIGFFVLLAIIQCVLFLPLYLHASMRVIVILLNITLTVVFLGSTFIIFIKKERFCYKNIQLKQLVLDYCWIAVFIFLHFLICYSTNSLTNTTADQTFYINFVENNINAINVNTVAPLSGNNENVQAIYNFQSFYIFLSYIAQIFNIKSILVTVWLVPFLLWIVIALSLLNIIHYFNVSEKIWIKYGFLLIIYILAIRFNYLVRYNMYGNNFREYIFLYIFIFYFEFYKNKVNKNIYLINFLFLAGLSIQSTSFFLGIMVLIGMIIYDIFFSKDRVLNKLIISGIPLIVYFVFYYLYLEKYTIVFIFGCLMFFYIISQLLQFSRNYVIEFLYSNVFKNIIVVVFLLILGISIYGDILGNINPPVSFHDFNYNIYEYYFDFVMLSSNGLELLENILIMLVRLIFLILNVYMCINLNNLKEDEHFFITIQIILILLFYNPLVSAVISKYCAGAAYYRVRSIIVSFPVIILILKNINKIFSNLKFKILDVLIVLSALIYSLTVINYVNTDYYKIDNSVNYSYLYRMDKAEVELGYFLDNYIEEYYMDSTYKPLILTDNFRLSYYSSNFRMIYTVDFVRKKDDNKYKEENSVIYYLMDIINNPTNYDDVTLKKLISLLKDYKIEFVVIPNNSQLYLNLLFSQNGKLIYKGPIYTIYHFIY